MLKSTHSTEHEVARGLPSVVIFVSTTMWAAVALFVFAVLWFVLRPRRGGKNAPPLVTDYPSPVSVPFFGILIEFFSGPQKLIQRCVEEIGPVFTIPVSNKGKSCL